MLPRLRERAQELAQVLGRKEPVGLEDVDTTAAIGERVGSAPDSSPEAFAADLWDDGVERAGDLADAVSALALAREDVGSKFSDAAWRTDLSGARSILATHGTSIFRFLNGEWRRSDRLVKSVLANPKTPLHQLLPLLDALDRGRIALDEIKAGDAFGAKAFGADWRGEKSAAAPLQALVSWMRSLKGLGAEPRLIVARRPDRSAIAVLSAQVRQILNQVHPDADGLSTGIGGRNSQLFGASGSVVTTQLTEVIELTTAWASADGVCHSIFASVPADLSQRLTVLTSLAVGQTARDFVEADADLGREAFGGAWQDRTSDWSALADAAKWIGDNPDIRLLASRVLPLSGPLERIELVQSQLAAADADHAKLNEDLEIPGQGADVLARAPFADVQSRLDVWIDRHEDLSKWVAYTNRAERGRAFGLGGWVEGLHEGGLLPGDALASFEMSYYETLFADMIRLDGELGRFDGAIHSRLVREFSALDQQRLLAARLDVARTHHRGIPPQNGGAVGPLGVLRGEMARRRGHMAIRKLVDSAAPAIQALKPVFMMSPLSVAQFLPPGKLTFDLLVMDEASQIQPVDALGAIARCRQVVVVGDPQQLPPTAFFSKMTGAGDEEADDDGAQVADIESILGLFKARGLPERMLRWHYRSRHQSLIAVSNRQFYENKLIIVPSPYTSEAGMGLRFHHVADGLFDTGKTRMNVVEARVVAKAIIEHAREHPELSLGVAAFSAQQGRAIREELEALRRALPASEEAFFQAHPSEPFFIKNLENVQGDERDVIFISVGYGPSVAGGRPAMRFGPLGTSGGERRLNVLISRAKRRCEVFSSITDDDIDAEFASTRKGVFAFKLFLHFARTGRMTMVESAGRDQESVFEEQIAAALQARGYQVHRNVGIAGLFVDLAVADPDRPGCYLLGVECDGPSYRGARSARDRDRLRQAVLEDHGWIIHRLWSADWFQRPNEQLNLIVSAIEAAKIEWDNRQVKTAKASRAVPVELTFVEREDTTEIGLTGVEDVGATVSAAYAEAELVRPAHCWEELHAAPIGALTTLVEQTVAVEGPVHIDEVVNRIRACWGLKRAGGRIQEAVERAASVAVRQGRLNNDSDFLSVPGHRPRLRDRSEVQSPTLRRPEMLPTSEIQAGILDIVKTNYGATADQIVQSLSRSFGFKATSTQLRTVIEDVIQLSTGDQLLVRQDGILVTGPAAAKVIAETADATSIEALVAQGEHEGLEFKQTLRWDIVANQVNKKLEDVVVKTVAAFANKHGGTLLIGVCDDGVVSGLGPDFACLGGNCDKLELHLTNLFNNHFGQAFRAAKIRITFPFIGAVQICRVDVQSATSQMIVKLADRTGQIAERFFVRAGNSSQELSLSEMSAYAKERFK